MAALQCCHAHGVAHRDVTLVNVLLDANFNIKLCDFGLSVLKQDLSQEMCPVFEMVYRGGDAWLPGTPVRQYFLAQMCHDYHPAACSAYVLIRPALPPTVIQVV